MHAILAVGYLYGSYFLNHMLVVKIIHEQLIARKQRWYNYCVIIVYCAFASINAYPQHVHGCPLMHVLLDNW